MERKAAETYTLALLARREYSSLEIREKLQHRGISPEAVSYTHLTLPTNREV